MNEHLLRKKGELHAQKRALQRKILFECCQLLMSATKEQDTPIQKWLHFSRGQSVKIGPMLDLLFPMDLVAG